MGSRTGQYPKAHRAARTGPVVDDDVPFEFFCKRIRHKARHGVGTASGRERHQQLQGLRRIGVGRLGNGGDGKNRSEERRVGKSVSVRVDLGGRRIIKKKKKSNYRYEKKKE